MFNKKSIVLSDLKNENNMKAVLTLQEDASGISGLLRLYNFPHELAGICSLGLYVDKKVYKAGLTLKAHMLYEFFIDLKKIPQNFSVAIVNFQNAVATPILYGSSEGSNEDVYGSIISDISGLKSTVKNVEKVLDEHQVDFAEEEKQEIEKAIDKAMCEGNCSECVYKKFFYENQAMQERPVEFQSTKSIASQIQPEEKSLSEKLEEKPLEKPKQVGNCDFMFFDKIKPQIDNLFKNNPTENNLQSLIPSSKWVKVEYEDDGDFYVFGLLYDEDENVKYVCYGIPAVFEENPPKELSGFPVWLPVGEDKGFGYWLTYQDACTGEPVKAIID